MCQPKVYVIGQALEGVVLRHRVSGLGQVELCVGFVGEIEDVPEQYVNGITVLEAVVIAGGFTKRAKESEMQIIRGTDRSRTKQDAIPETTILPGDVIEVPQRYF